MVINSSNDGPCSEFQTVGKINIKINEQEKATIESGFTEHELCLPFNHFNVANDIFQLQSSDSDGFCIESVLVNDKEILRIDSTQNPCTDDGMTTSSITIQNEEIINFKCSG